MVFCSAIRFFWMLSTVSNRQPLISTWETEKCLNTENPFFFRARNVFMLIVRWAGVLSCRNQQAECNKSDLICSFLTNKRFNTSSSTCYCEQSFVLAWIHLYYISGSEACSQHGFLMWFLETPFFGLGGLCEGSTQPLTKMRTRDLPGGKGRPVSA
jgi:hypothetical protein